MNELERLVASIPRPEPTDRLDKVVRSVFVEQRRRRLLRRSRGAAGLIATAVFAGLLGFSLGRHSVAHVPGAGDEARAGSFGRPLEVARATGPVFSIQLEDEQFAGLFLNTPKREGMLGTGALSIEASLMSP